MKHDNEVQVYFTVFGDYFNPNELTNILQVAPIQTYVKGDEIPPMKGLYRKPDAKPPVYIETVWDYGNPDCIKTLELEDAYKVVEEGLRDKVDLINQFVRQHHLTTQLNVYLTLDKDYPLRIHFKTTFLKMMCDLNAEIDFDTYIIY
jgi:hypothetical protein